MAVKRKYRLNLRNYGNLPAIMLSQYDEGYALEFDIRDGTDAASDLSAYAVALKGTRADTLAYSFAGTVSTNVLTFVIDTTMTACAGRGTAEIAIKDTANDVLFATFNMPVFVERAAVPEGSIDADVERAQEIAEQVQEIVDSAAAAVSGEAEKWATGQIDGTDVPSTDPAYENNAKYYAEQAESAAASIGIDATLTQAGEAADAKKTGDEITALKEDLNHNTGQSEVTGWEDGYYVLNASATTVDVENKNGSSDGYVATYTQCTAGDVFYVTSKGATAARSWAFLSSASDAGNIISRANQGTFTKQQITAPAGSRYVVFNAKASNPYLVTKGVYLDTTVIRTETDIDFTDETLPYATLADLPRRRIFRTINAPDRPSNQPATTGFNIITIKPLNASNYAQIGVNAKTGRMWARYAGASQSYSDWVEVGTRAAEDVVDANKKTVRMLCIGNSYSQDSIAYMPFILRGLTDSINLTLGIAYLGSATLQMYVDRFNNDTADITYNKLAYDSDKWTSAGSKTIKQILAAEPWDIVTFQQGSQQQESWSNYGALNTLIDDVVGYIATTHGKSVRAGWLMPQIRLNQATADSYANMIECVKKVLETSPCSFVIPCGTGIHLARQNETLNALGDYGGLTYEGVHLQEGLPCLLSAYVSTMKILELFGIGYKSVLGEQTRPTQEWITAKAIPGQNGTSVGVTDANCYLAQKIATQAIKFHYGEE